MLAGETLASGAVPVPFKLTVCGLFGALSETESVPVITPAAIGANTTLITQLLPAGRLVPQLSLSPKLELAVIPEMLNKPAPMFVNEIA
jgi:hypothetical protein